MKAIVYIDGFNPVLRRPQGHSLPVVDLEALCRALVPKDEVVLIRYFTARVTARPGDPAQPQRQETYLRALSTLPLVTVHFGEFRAHPVRMRLANPPAHGPKTVEVIKTEEKGSDVNLASFLLLDAFQERADTAVVISNNSDLAEPVRIVKEVLGHTVGVINPYQAARRSRSLNGTFFKQLRRGVSFPRSGGRVGCGV